MYRGETVMPVIRRLLRPFARYRRYAQPAAGYIGWYELPVIGVVAFDAGDRLAYSW